MSARIKQIIEVIKEVRDNFRIRRMHGSLRNMRIDAMHSVAARREIEYRSVEDKCVRQLKPEISTVKDFDKLIEDWLNNDSNTLKDIILKHRSDSRDDELINNTFYKPSDEESLLADTFDCDPNDQYFREGKEILRLHLAKERNQYLIKYAKTIWEQQTEGNIRCSICNFSFEETYGHLGKGYIEAHHILPVSSLKPNTIVTINDLVPICSNCHTIIHRSKPLLTVEILKQSIEYQENSR